MVDALEGRALLAVSALDPSFGAGGVVLGTVDTLSGPDLSAPSAVAVQPDGKVVVVGTYAPTNGVSGIFYQPSTLGELAVRRYNADGSVDTSFGTNGQADIPLGDASYRVQMAPHNVAVAPDGSIVLAADLTGLPGTSLPLESIVAKLTPGGVLDTSFASDGVYEATGALAGVNAVAVQADGKVVAEGIRSGSTEITVLRLTTAGVLDASFNGTGSQIFAPSSLGQFLAPGNTGVAVGPGGQIYALGSTNVALSNGGMVSTGTLTRISTDGTLDTTFAAGGTAVLVPSGVNSPDFVDLAVQPDGAVVVLGNNTADATTVPFLVRYRTDGTFDPNFLSTAATPVDEAATPVSRTANSLALEPDGSIVVGNRADQVTRFLATGAVDTGFGIAGTITYKVYPTYVPVASGNRQASDALSDLAVTSAGKVVVVGTATTLSTYFVGHPSINTVGAQEILAQLTPQPLARVTPGDYDGDGKADVAAELASLGIFAFRPSGGGADVLEPFGIAGLGQTVPTTGDYDGDGKADVAGYLAAYGYYAYRPSGGGADVVEALGIEGLGQAIPAPGDYDGDGKTDAAVYVPSENTYSYRPSSGAPDVNTQFGVAGVGNSIPAPGDYDDDGKTDLAVYLPSVGAFVYRPSSIAGNIPAGTAIPDVIVPFGIPGAGQTIPEPGDYDGDGKIDIAAYLPSLGIFAYRPSSGGPDVLEPFGVAGAGNSIPAPADYDGDGKTDLAAYLPSLGIFAYRPSSGGPDVLQQFGATGTGQSVPAASIPYAQPPTITAAGVGAGVSAASVVSIPLTDDLLPEVAAKKRSPRA